MKKTKINEFSLPSFGGECIGYVLSKYHDRGIMCKPVYKRRVKHTPRQREVQERFAEATQYAKYVMGDLERREAYERTLTKINGSLFPAIVADYLRNGERLIVPEPRNKSGAAVQDDSADGLARTSASPCRGKRLTVNSKPSQSAPFSLPANGEELISTPTKQAGLPANGKESKFNSKRQAGGKGRGKTKSKQ